MKMYQLVPIAYLQRLVAIQQKYEPDNSTNDLPDKATLVEKKEPPKTPIFYDEENLGTASSSANIKKPAFKTAAEGVLENMPKKGRRKAAEVLQYLLLVKGISLDEHNRLVYSDGTVGSLLYSLLSHAIHSPYIRASMKTMPKDWNQFSTLLENVGAPKSMYVSSTVSGGALEHALEATEKSVTGGVVWLD